MASVGTPAFFRAYCALFRARVPIATFLMMRFDPGKPPCMLDAWWVRHKVPGSAVTEYLENTYRFDPFFRHRDVPRDGGVYRLPEIAPDRFFSSAYYLQYYRSIGLCDELGLLAPLPSGAMAHISMSRFDDMGPFKRRELQCLKHHAPLLLELLCQHCVAVGAVDPLVPQKTSPPLADLVRSHASETLGAGLTLREGQIAALVLQGHSNASAGLTLGVSRETCKVHRRNMYRKLAISSQRDLFGLLKHLL